MSHDPADVAPPRDEVTRQQFRQIAENAADAIVFTSADSEIYYLNPAAERLFGYRADEVQGRSLTQLLHDRARPAGVAAFGRYTQVAHAGLLGPPIHLAAVNKNGIEFPVEMTLAGWQQGTESFFTVIVRDASEREHAEQRLREALVRERDAREQLRVQDDLKYTVLQAVAHDLRDPIAALVMIGRLLASDGENGGTLTPQSRSRLVSDIGRSAHRMERLLEDLINADPKQRVTLSRESVDLAELVEDCLRDSDVAELHPVHTRLDPVVVSADRGQVSRLVYNLLQNAARHVPAGIPLWVTVTQSEQGAEIRVEDAGAGVAEEFRQQIFEPFRRGPAVTTSGAGLGLSLVSRFAELHGGRAWCTERVGGGASFRVCLPVEAMADA